MGRLLMDHRLLPRAGRARPRAVVPVVVLDHQGSLRRLPATGSVNGVKETRGRLSSRVRRTRRGSRIIAVVQRVPSEHATTL